MRNWERWSDIVVVMLPYIISVEIILEKIWSIIAFELEITPIGWIVYERSIDDAKESNNLLVGEFLSYFETLTL